MQSQKRFSDLIDKYISGDITVEETDELFSLIATGQYDDLLEEHVHGSFHSENIPGSNMSSHRAEELMQKILHAEKDTARLLPGIFRKNKKTRWYMAAAIATFLLVGGWVLMHFMNHREKIDTQRLAEFLVERTNTSDRAQKIKLEDSSFITLQPGSTVRFPSHFLPDKREVYLDGEAFFKVSKNAERPFFVYYNNIVTHVLGTSFTVKTDKLKKQVEVSVVTGKVQVYEKRNTTTDHSKSNGVILTANQKVIYKEEEKQFTATLVNDPLPVVQETEKKNITDTQFAFQETSLLSVFKLLEKMYGIEIVVDNDRLYNCRFTGNIAQYDLFTKLDVICASVKANYQVVGTRILVKGKGCN